MLKVGLTGGIGSGKSTVSLLFKKLGIKVIDADVIAKEITQPNLPATQKIIMHFGTYILNTKGEIDRQKLKQLIFSNKEAKKWLETCLHPVILQIMKKQSDQVQSPYCILVIPLLKEIPESLSLVDRILVVDAPLTLQLKRIQRRDGLSEETARNIISTQATQQQRLSIAHDVITNHQGEKELEAQVNHLHAIYLSLAQAF